MPKRSRKPPRKIAKKQRHRKEPDVNQVAHWIMTQTTDAGTPAEKNPHAVALGRLGGKKGGPARAERLTPKQRADIAMKAARARWGAKS